MNYIKIELKWAFIIVVSMLVWILLEDTMGWENEYIAAHFWITLLYIPIAFLFYYLSIKEKRRRYYHGSLRWSQGVVSGLILSIFVALLSPFVQYFTQEYLAPAYFPNVIAYTLDHRLLTLQEAVNEFNLPYFMLQAGIATIVAGTLTAAIISIFLSRQKKKSKKKQN